MNDSYDIADDILVTDVIFSGSCSTSNDTIYILENETPMGWMKMDSVFLEVLTDDISWAKKGTQFSRMNFRDADGRLIWSEGNWSEGKKDGYWLFF